MLRKDPDLITITSHLSPHFPPNLDDIESVVARGSDRTVSRAYSIHVQVSIRIFACIVSRPAGLGARPDHNMHHVLQVSLGRSPSRLMKFGL